MAPNQLQSSHVAEKCVAALNLKNGPARISDRPLIRTEYVINNVYYYQLELSDDSVLKTAANPLESQVCAAFRNLVDEFRLAYLEPITDLCGQLAIPADSLTAVFGGVANELFCEGITWARIVTLCVFASELAAKCLKENGHESIVEEIRMCLLHYVQDNLENWIFDHDGWEGIIAFSEGNKGKENPKLKSPKPSLGWAKTVLHGTVRMFGTLATIANSTGQMAFPMHTS